MTGHGFVAAASLCVCVCVRERERERESIEGSEVKVMVFDELIRMWGGSCVYKKCGSDGHTLVPTF